MPKCVFVVCLFYFTNGNSDNDVAAASGSNCRGRLAIHSHMSMLINSLRSEGEFYLPNRYHWNRELLRKLQEVEGVPGYVLGSGIVATMKETLDGHFGQVSSAQAKMLESLKSGEDAIQSWAATTKAR